MLLNVGKLLGKQAISFTASPCDPDSTMKGKIRYEIRMVDAKRHDRKGRVLYYANIEPQDEEARKLFVKAIEWLSFQVNILRYRDVFVEIGSTTLGRYVDFVRPDGNPLTTKVNGINPTFITSEMTKALLKHTILPVTIYNPYLVMANNN